MPPDVSQPSDKALSHSDGDAEGDNEAASLTESLLWCLTLGRVLDCTVTFSPLSFLGRHSYIFLKNFFIEV